MAPSVPDLVVLSMLCEEPMHGYALNQELIRRDVHDWAGISRPQVYYSIKKLLGKGWLEPVTGKGSGAGPERQVVGTSRAGKKALANGLSDEWWPRQRTIPPFLTWLALSHYARKATRRRVIEQRRTFVTSELVREQETLIAIRSESGPMIEAAGLMVELTIRQFEVELSWLDEVSSRMLA